MKLVFKTVNRTCLMCEKEYSDNTGCVLCPDCVEKNARMNAILHGETNTNYHPCVMGIDSDGSTYGVEPVYTMRDFQ